jgi:hypothetical protein
LALQQHFYLAPPIFINGIPTEQPVFMACCGAPVYYDIDLTGAGEIEIDITNPNGDGVDGFLTSVGCARLFDLPYAGSGTPLCGTHIGPVRPRTVSQRVKMPAGRYRLFAQGYSSNSTTMEVSLDMGVWSRACRWNPIAQ